MQTGGVTQEQGNPNRQLFPGPYRKREKAFLKKHPDLRERYFKTLLLRERISTDATWHREL
ncbi:hypothetical protein ACWJKU_12955 [Methylocaldum sp. MU1018]